MSATPVIGLVFGGATKIKEYVFEAPRLPEIRGASAMLDWVNSSALPDLWVRELAAHGMAEAAARAAIIYASGGNVLALAPADHAAALAQQIERTYTDWTISAQSAAVAMTVPLLSLRYGRDPLAYWVEQFRNDMQDSELRPLLEPAYPSNLDCRSMSAFFGARCLVS
ncbi:MAG: hypothetical protein HC822_26950 [Oscillochloris sp.]|nr:hypothetical protein [Oscillochloris sp.]